MKNAITAEVTQNQKHWKPSKDRTLNKYDKLCDASNLKIKGLKA